MNSGNAWILTEITSFLKRCGKKTLFGKFGNMEYLNIFRNNKVLVTGHTGFKGSWLSIWLEMLGAKVIGFALDPIYDNGIFLTSGIGSLIRDYRGDIRDLANLTQIFEKENPEIVFHLAAQPLVLDSYKNPAETFNINVQGTVNVLEAIRNCPSVKAAVIITTDKCYENHEWIWGYRENEPMGGHDPYSASKGAAELVIKSYQKSFFNEIGKPAVASARAGNVIGGGDWAENRLVPDIMKSIMGNKPIGIRNPQATRPWQHVIEPLSGYLKLAAALMNSPTDFTGAWNFGPYLQDIYTVQEVAEKIIHFAGKGKWQEIPEQQKPHEANLLMLDISKAVQKLKWRPILTFNDQIELTVNWYMNFQKMNVLELTRNQIRSYQNKWNLLNGN
jgi:CDP-glucose 4,6-dehydratase